MWITDFPRPVVHYHFGCKQGQPDVLSSGPLLGELAGHHMTPPLCHLSSNGIVGPLESLDTVTALQHAASDALAMEVWFTIINDSTVTTPIMALALEGYTPNPDCHGYRMALTLRDRWLELRYTEEEHCRAIVLRQKELVRGRLQQLAVVWSGPKTYVYFDGNLVVHGAQNHLDPTMSDWDGSMKLFLMGSQRDSGSSLSMLSIFNQNLSELEISSLYTLGKSLIRNAKMNRTPVDVQVHARPIHASSQDMSSVVELFSAFDLSSLNATVPHDWIAMVEISSLPPHGSLSDGNGVPVNLHDRFLYPATVHYHPASGYFNAPNTSHNGTNIHLVPETFSYRVLAVDFSQEVLATSAIVWQQLLVLHTNHPPILKPPEAQTLFPIETSASSMVRPGVMIHGVQVIDVDKDIDRIRVDLWVGHGTLSVATLQSTDFATCRFNERRAQGINATWGCHGSGKLDRNMTFVATPSDASFVLSTILYHGFGVDQEDEIFIRIYDGAGGPCLSLHEHDQRFASEAYFNTKYHRSRDEVCFEAVVVIPVRSFSKELKNVPSNDGSYIKCLLDADNFSQADGVFWGLMGLIILCCCVSFRRCIRLGGARGSKVSSGSDATRADLCREEEVV